MNLATFCVKIIPAAHHPFFAYIDAHSEKEAANKGMDLVLGPGSFYISVGTFRTDHELHNEAKAAYLKVA